MKHALRLLTAITVILTTSFTPRNKPLKGLNEDNLAPNFTINIAGTSPTSLKELRGSYVLLQFWSGQDAPSRLLNAQMSRLTQRLPQVQLLSVSMDQQPAVYSLCKAADNLQTATCFCAEGKTRSHLLQTYGLKRGMRNFLINPQGIIIAKDITAEQAENLLKTLS